MNNLMWINEMSRKAITKFRNSNSFLRNIERQWTERKAEASYSVDPYKITIEFVSPKRK